MIRSVVKSERTYFWIGLQDLNNTGEYFWLTTDGKNHSVSYTNWNKHQPRESCAELKKKSLRGETCSHYKWFAVLFFVKKRAEIV